MVGRDFPMDILGRKIAALSRKPDEAGWGDDRLKTVAGFGANPGELVMRIHAPAAREPKAALVVVLHGCTQTAGDYAAPAGWLDLADRYGFVVLTPQQTRANNPNLCFNWYQKTDAERGRGEPASIAGMIAHAVRLYGIDPGRIFITGLSAGGAMTAVMLATYPELFSGGAIVAGLPYAVAGSLPDAFEAMSMSAAPPGPALGDLVRGATPHSDHWPTVTVWHGQSDRIVRPAAGEAVAAQWRDVHGANEPARAARTPDGRAFLVWFSPAGHPVVELHRIAGLAHGAPVKQNGSNSWGYASRYTPDIGLSSSFEIALGWGIVHGETEPSRAEPLLAGDQEAAPDAGREPRGSREMVAGVINDALRAAGLLR